MHLTNVIACAVLSVSACSLLAYGQRPDEHTIREIDAAWSQALQDKDLDKLMSNYADDADFLPPDEPIVRGLDNIRAWFGKRIATPGYSASFAATSPTKWVRFG